MSGPLSERTAAVLAFVERYYAEHGVPPSMREIGDACGITSSSVVSYHLDKLAGGGLVVRRPTVARGCVPVAARSQP